MQRENFLSRARPSLSIQQRNEERERERAERKSDFAEASALCTSTSTVLLVPKEEEGKSSVRTDFSKARYIGQNAFRTFAEKSGKVNLYTTIVYIQRCCKVRSPL